MRRSILTIATVLIVGALICAVVGPFSDTHPFRIAIPGLSHRYMLALDERYLVFVTDGNWGGIRWHLPTLCFYGVCSAFALLLALLPNHIRHLSQARRVEKLRHGLCPTCGYNLTGNTSGICPECGTNLAEYDAKQRDQKH